jgi:protein-S-isoprenylcysteine O-methyltransferase Ste14
VPFFILMLVLPPDFHGSTPVILIALLGIILAEALRLWAVGYAGSSTRTRGDYVPELVHAGPFCHVRNPLYVANIVLYTLTGVVFGFVWLSLVLFVYSCAQYLLIVCYEEEILEATFHEKYVAYRSAVPRWIPTLFPAIQSSRQCFSLKSALRSERSTLTVMGTLVVFWFVKYFLL